MTIKYLLKELPVNRTGVHVYLDQKEPLVSHYNHAVITADTPQTKGGVFTSNSYVAPPSLISRGHAESPFFSQETRLSIPEPPTLSLDSAIYGGRLFPNRIFFLLETLPRLVLLKQLGDFPIIFHCQAPLVQIYQQPCQNYLLNALDIQPEKIIEVKQVLAVDTLFIPWPTFEIRRKIHKSFFDVTQNLIPYRADNQSGNKKLYIPPLDFEVSYQAEIEEVFSTHGFNIMKPNELTFLQQVEAFQSADVIAGFFNIVFFNLLFCQKNKKILYLSTEKTFNINAVLIDKARNDESVALFLETERVNDGKNIYFKIKESINEMMSEVEAVLTSWSI